MLKASNSPTNGYFPAYNSATGGFTWTAAAAGGGVSSVGLSMPSIFTVSGSPITSSGTLTVSVNKQSANTVYCGHSSGLASTPTFRSLVLDDMPFGYASSLLPGIITAANFNTFNGKQAAITGGASTITTTNLTASRALESDGSGKVVASSTTATQLGYINSLSSNAQDQLNAKANLSGAAFTGAITGTSITLTGDLTCKEGYRGNSDVRLKKNIQNIKLDASSIKLKQFAFKSDLTNRVHYGVIAQEVEKIAPELVYTDDKGIKSVGYIDLLIAKIESLEKDNKILFDRIKKYLIISVILPIFN